MARTDVRQQTGFHALDWIAMILLIIGGLNWGLVGLMDIDLVATVFGRGTMVSRVVYGLVGLSALYGLYLISKMGSRNSTR